MMVAKPNLHSTKSVGTCGGTTCGQFKAQDSIVLGLWYLYIVEAMRLRRIEQSLVLRLVAADGYR